MFLITGLLFMINLSLFGQEEWRVYEYGNFKIDFYQEPEFTTDTTLQDSSFIVSQFWEADITDSLHDNTYYSLNLMTYPPDYIHSDSAFTLVEGFINSTQTKIVNDGSFTLLASYLIELHGFPGKLFRWKSNETNNFLEFQVYLVGNSVFILSVVSKAGENHNKYIKKYFNSFELINIPPGKYSLPIITTERTFKVDFPGEPEHSNKIMDSDYGKLDLDVLSYEPVAPKGNLAYVAMETKYQDLIIDSKDLYTLNTYYKRAIDGLIATSSGELISINDIYYKEFMGKEFRCYLSGGALIIVYRMFLIKSNMYLFGVLAQADQDQNKEMNKFLDSFKLTK